MNTDVEEAEEYLLKLSNFLRFSVEIKNNRGIVMGAVQNNGLALKFGSNEIKNNR